MGALAGLRDRALLSVMLYSFARVSAVLGMRRQDYFGQAARCWLRLHEKGGKRHDVPAHHRAAAALDAYLAGARTRGAEGGALPGLGPHGAPADGPGAPGDDQSGGPRPPGSRPRRAATPFRATGITACRPRRRSSMTGRADTVTVDEIERIVI